MDQVAPNVYVEAGFSRVTVGAILTEAGWVCIDTPTFPREARQWLADLHTISPKPICYVINTDHHRDRILCNGHFDAPVVAQEQAARFMLTLRGSFISQAAEELSANDNELVDIASLRLAPPQVSFSQALYLECGDRAVTLLGRPSATAGSLWVVLAEERVIFAGDSMTADRHPYIDGGDSKQWLNTLGDIRRGRYDGWTLIPGRGDALTNTSRLEPLAEYLRVARRRVNSLCRAGRPRSETGPIVAELLPMFPSPEAEREEIARRIRIGLEAIYDELASGNGADDEES